MGLVSWLVAGLLVGLLARCVFPGRPGGLAAVLVLSAIGALTGGYIATYFGAGSMARFDAHAALSALAGAALMAVVIRILRL